MKKVNYIVSVDITMSRNVEVMAESEEDAINQVNKAIEENPYEYANNFTHYVKHEAIDAIEESI